MAEYQRSTLYQAVEPSRAEEGFRQAEMEFFGGMSREFQKWSDVASAEVGEEVGFQEGADATRTITLEDGTTKEVPEFQAHPLAGFTAFGKAYNQAAEMAYESRISSDFAQTAVQLRSDFQTDLEGFDKSSEAFEKAYFKGMRGKELLAAKDTWGQYKSQARQKVQLAQQKIQLAKSVESIYQGRDTHLQAAILTAGEGDMEGAQSALEMAKRETAKLIQLGESPRVLNAKIEQAYKDIEKEFIVGGAQALVAQGRYGDAKELAAGYEYKVTSASEQKALRSAVTTMINDAEYVENIGELERTKAENDARADAAANLEIRNNRGQASYEEIDKAEANGIITPQQRVQMYAKKDSIKAKAQKGAAESQLVADAISGGKKLDPDTKAHRDAVENAYQTAFVNQGVDPLGDGMPQAAALANATGIIPESLQSRMRVAIKGNNPEAAIQTAQLMGMMDDLNRSILDQFDATERAFARNLYGMLKTNTDPETAYAMARSQAYPEDPNLLEMKRNTYKTEHKDGNRSVLNNSLDEFDPGPMTFQPEVTSELLSDFNTKVEHYYTHTEDIDMARKNAWADMKGYWGATTINGSLQMMKYAPEADRPDLTSEWISNQLHAEVRANFDLPEDSEIMLKADAQTAREPQGGRSWVVMEVGPDGIVSPIRDENGLEMRYSPTVTDMAEYKEMQREKKAKMVGARKARRDAGMYVAP